MTGAESRWLPLARARARGSGGEGFSRSEVNG
jgi:hypothetical protein